MKANYLNAKWKESMTLKLDYNNMMAEYVGSEQGIRREELSARENLMRQAFQRVEDSRGVGMTGWMDLPYNQAEEVREIIETAREIKKKFDYFVVLGIGGSALGPIAVFQALCHLHYNDLPKSVRKTPKFYVEDNVDPERMRALLDVIDVKKTVFNVITKSGATSETMAQYLIIYDILKARLGEDAGKHIIATTSESTAI